MTLTFFIPLQYGCGMDLKRLKSVVVVAEEGHLTRAAERLGLQQPPLTRQIRTLEDELGVRLFERLPRGMRATEAGRAVAEEAAAILARVERLPDLARRAARGEHGRLALGVTSSGAFHPFVAQQIRAFRAARPGVRLELAEDGTPELVRGLAEERLDAAFVRSTGALSPDLVVEPLLSEPMVAAVPTDHPLALARDLPLADLAQETFVFYRRPSGPGLHDAIVAACLQSGFSPTVGQEAPRMASTLGLVAAGLGVSLVPASMQRMNVEGVAFVPLAGDGPAAPLLLVTRRRGRSAVLEGFRAQVKAAVSS